MTRTVVITLHIDPTEYHEAEDTPKGTIELVAACLQGEADLPTQMTIVCEDVSREIDLEDNYF